ncbi:barstar family protein [Hymenobacter sp. BRD128]|uniref:barstar family protein n=1 Tax=Hymenobacter sp. BRD128 TaxID=2675878 RepID=UPI001563B8F4|nr:barstar family protein [Hymenobacter sp. BRD128]QKG56371.1 barstar family protein [Hymenobacter sp. BRD128]
MKTVVLPGRQLATRDELHDWLNEALAFPYYGRNLDALWDLISATIPLPVTLIWQDFAHSQLLLGDYADRTLQVFQEAADLDEGCYLQVD